MAEQLTPSQQSGEIPQNLVALSGEWTFINTTAPPPATGQIRLNSGQQSSATAMYVSRTSALGVDAAGMLADLKTGHVIRLQTRDDATRWQIYAISADPINQGGTYTEIPVTWQSGGAPLAQQRTLLTSTASLQVPVTSPAVAASVGNAAVSINVRTLVGSAPMTALAGTPSTDTVRFLPGYAFPGTSPDGISLGMTLRQWYAGQAIVGFVSSNPAANLIGRLPQFCFRLADSMIAFEAAEVAGFIESPIPTNAPPRGQQTPPTQQAVAPSPTQAVALRQVR